MKLVRDKIPEIIEEDGKWCLCRKTKSKEEHVHFLKEKIIEEVDEFICDPSYEEAADVLEVLLSFCSLSNLDFEKVLLAAENKREKNGGFQKGIVLVRVGKDEDE